MKQHQSEYGAPAIQGSVTQGMSTSLGKTVYTLKGSIPSRNTLIFPGKQGSSLNLYGSYLYIFLKLAPKQHFSIYINVDCRDDSRYKIGFSDLFKEYKVKVNSISIPATFLPREEKWTIFAVDLDEIIKKGTEGKKLYKSLLSIQFCSTMEVWNVFASGIIYDAETLPREMYLPIGKDENWYNRYSFEWYPVRPFQHLIDQELPLRDLESARTSVVSTNSAVSQINPLKKMIPRWKRRPNASQKYPSSILNPDPLIRCKQRMGFTGKYCSQIIFSENSGEKIFYICSTSIVCLTRSTKRQRLLLGHTEEVCGISANRSSTLLVSAQSGQSPIIRIWNLNTFACVAMIGSVFQEITCIDMNDAGTMIVVVGKDQFQKQVISMWDITEVIQTGKPPLILKHPVLQHIRSIKFVPGSDSKIVTCGDQNIRFWRMKNGVLRGCTLVEENVCLIQKQQFLSLAFERAQLDNKLQADSHKLYISTSSGCLYQIDYKNRLIESVYQLHEGPIRTIYIHEGICVTGSDDRFIRVWPLDFSDFFLEAQLDSPITSAVLSEDALTLAVGTELGSLGCLDFTHQKYTTLMRSHSDSILSVDIDPHHPEFVTISKDNTVRIWDASTFDQLYQFDTVGEYPVSVVYHPVQYQIAVGFSSGILRIFDIATTSVIEEYKAHKSSVLDLIYSPNGRWLITVSLESLVISDCNHMYQPIKVLHFLRESESISLALSPNGDYLASCGPAGNIVHIYSCRKDFEEIKSFETGSSDIFVSIKFSADSKSLFALTSESRLLSFSMHRNETPKEWLHAHRKMATSISTSDNGEFIVTGGSDGIVKIWDSKFSRGNQTIPYQSFGGHYGIINKVLFSKNGDYIVSVGNDCITVWGFEGVYEQNLKILTNVLAKNEQKAQEYEDIDDISEIESDIPKTPDFQGILSIGGGMRRLLDEELLNDEDKNDGIPSPVLSRLNESIHTSPIDYANNISTQNQIQKQNNKIIKTSNHLDRSKQREEKLNYSTFESQEINPRELHYVREEKSHDFDSEYSSEIETPRFEELQVVAKSSQSISNTNQRPYEPSSQSSPKLLRSSTINTSNTSNTSAISNFS